MRKQEAGFSLLELAMVVAVIGIVVGTSVTVLNNMLPGLRADSALETVVSKLRQARFSAVDQRRDLLLTFKGTNEILLQRQEINLTTGAVTGTTQIDDTFLPVGITYIVMSGVADTPDNLTNSGAVSGFGCSGNTTPCTLTFQSDGQVLKGTALANGTISFGVAGNQTTQRAVTIMGAAGRIKGYHFNGQVWF
jgi:prepilin-type N-terminal cleavage/methylation domain-containing protein